jgi:hypothetical protein
MVLSLRPLPLPVRRTCISAWHEPAAGLFCAPPPEGIKHLKCCKKVVRKRRQTVGRQKSHRNFGYSVDREITQTERVIPVAKTTVNLVYYGDTPKLEPESRYGLNLWGIRGDREASQTSSGFPERSYGR